MKPGPWFSTRAASFDRFLAMYDPAFGVHVQLGRLAAGWWPRANVDWPAHPPVACWPGKHREVALGDLRRR